MDRLRRNLPLLFLALAAGLFALGEVLRVGPREVRAGLAVMAGVQLLLLLGFARTLRARRLRPAWTPASLPPAAILVACKGGPEDLEENAASLLEQVYPGRLELIFVVPSAEDGAHARLAPLMGGRARLLASGRAPERCSGKIVDLLFALERVAPGTEVLLFADADVRAPAHWARDLAAALELPGAGAATTACLHSPREADLWALLKLLWTAAGLPWFAARPFVWAGSFAVRREVFERLEVGKVWERSLLDDGALDGVLKRAGLGVAFVPSAMPVNRASSSASDFLGQFTRWLVYARHYTPGLWLAGGLGLAAKAGVAVWALSRPSRRWALAALAAVDAAYLAGVLLAARLWLGEKLGGIHPSLRPPELWAAVLSPLVTLAWLACFLRSGMAREIRWGGYRYLIRGPLDVEAVPLAQAAARTSTSAASR